MTKDSIAPTTLSLRLAPDERRLIEEAAGKKGWKAANFLRVSALERAAQVLNLSRPTSFDFSSAARRLADALIAPRKVNVFDEIGEPIGCFGAGASFAEHPYIEARLCDVRLGDITPAPLSPEEFDRLQEAMRLGGTEFGDELIVECRRVVSTTNDPNLPPPIDPHNLNS